MSPKKKAYSKLSKSAKYYRNNPKARKKKAATDTVINKRPEQRKKRSELSVARKRLKRKWVNLAWKDLAHTKNGLKLKSVKANRWSKWDTAWDIKARGSKKKTNKKKYVKTK